VVESPEKTFEPFNRPLCRDVYRAGLCRALSDLSNKESSKAVRHDQKLLYGAKHEGSGRRAGSDDGCETMEFRYGKGVTGPAPEFRTLNAIRASLLDPSAAGLARCIRSLWTCTAMKTRTTSTRATCSSALSRMQPDTRKEPVRSQGHVHAIAPHNGWSPPELFEIWKAGRIVYAQERTTDAPRCVAVSAGPERRSLCRRAGLTR